MIGVVLLGANKKTIVQQYNGVLFSDTTDYFKPSEKDFMINYRIENLEALLIELKKEGGKIVGKIQKFKYEKFAWILENEKNNVELWKAIDGILYYIIKNYYFYFLDNF